MAKPEFYSEEITGHPDLMNVATEMTARAYQKFSYPPKELKDVIADLLNGSFREREFRQLATFTKPNAEGDMVGTVRLVLPPKLEVREQFNLPPEVFPDGKVGEVARLTVTESTNHREILKIMWDELIKVASVAEIDNLVSIIPPRTARIVSFAGIRTEKIPRVTPRDNSIALKTRKEYPLYWDQNPTVYQLIDYPTPRK